MTVKIKLRKPLIKKVPISRLFLLFHPLQATFSSCNHQMNLPSYPFQCRTSKTFLLWLVIAIHTCKNNGTSSVALKPFRLLFRPFIV